MSECVVRMEMPKRCYECDMANGITCMATGGVYGREVPKMTWIRRRPDWCPIICQLPDGHGRLVDADDYIKHLFTEWVNGEISNSEWCDLRQWMNEATTIVPAVTERSET